MRLCTTVAVLATVFSLGHAERSLAQRVSIHRTNVSLETILDDLRIQTGYGFSVPGKIYEQAGQITLDKENVDLREVLDELAQRLGLQYDLPEGKKVIVIKEGEGRADGRSDARHRVSENGSLLILAFPIVTGKIVDSLGNPLSGASVRILDAERKRTSLQTQTDREGNFILRNVPDDATLEISYVGYITLHVKATTSVGRVVMRMEPSVLDEVVLNAGYYKTTEKKRTGSISKVGAEQIAEQPISDPLQALKGRVAGLLVSETNGVQGGAVNVQIRGNNSLASGSNPLYIVDGIPYPSSPLDPESLVIASLINANTASSPLNTLNPNDIESIEILKDADATAIYGSRGANGVILITTKRGKSGRTKLDIDYYSGIAQMNERMDLLSLPQYLSFRQAAFAVDGVTPTELTAPDLTLWSQTESTDFQDLFFGETAALNNANVSLSGGSQQTQFMLSGNYRNQGSTNPGDDLGLEKLVARLAIDHSMFSDKLKLQGNFMLGSERNKFAASSELYRSIITAPNYPLYNDDGSLYWSEDPRLVNPLAHIMRTSENKTQNLTSNLNLDYQIDEDLTFSTSVGYTSIILDQKVLRPIASGNPNTSTLNGYGLYGTVYTKNLIVEPKLTYRKSFVEKGLFNVLLGATYQSNENLNELLSGANFVNDELIGDIRSAANIEALFNENIDYRYASAYGRLGWEWDERYLANVSFRRDASSRFGPNKKTANFWAVSGAWLFSEEAFLKDSRAMSFGKLRASYGTSGNDQIPDYGYLPNYGSSEAYQGTTLGPLRIANANYSWEENKKLEIGLELGFVENRYRLTANFFRNRSGNQLVGQPLPTQTGFASYQANLPALVENKGWEVDLTAGIVNRQKFQWQSSINVTMPTNTLLEFPGLASSTYANQYIIGKPIDNFILYRFLGIDPATGLTLLEDVDGNGIYSRPSDFQYVGKTYPDIYGGWHNQFKIGNFGCSVLLQFRQGFKQNTFLGDFPSGSLGDGTFNIGIDALNHWSNPGDQAAYPMLGVTSTIASNSFIQFRQSSAVLSDADFIRLSNVYASYNLTDVFRGKTFSYFELYLSGQNIFTLTDYNGLNPESGPFAPPPLEIWSLGLKLTF